MNDILPHPLNEEIASALLVPFAFPDPRTLARGLVRLSRNFPEQACMACIPHLLQALSTAADPGRVLASFERFVESYPNRVDLTTLLSTQLRAIEILVLVFSSSQYLTEIMLRRPEQIHLLLDNRRLILKKTTELYTREALSVTGGAGTTTARLDALRRWQHGELLRIGAGDLLGRLDLSALTLQLSNLAEAVVRSALMILAEGQSTAGFAVIAMGKLGGRELNYSSDIDLLFLSNNDDLALRHLAQQLIDALAGITNEGFLYRVDMRLRPWGRTGALVSTLDAYLVYLNGAARLWEKQALLKARWIAGDATLGDEFLQRAAGSIFGFDPETIRREVLGMKQRTESYLRQRGRDWGEVKLGEGSIRDIEFVAQYLQLVHARRQPELRTGHTLEALRRLYSYGLLPAEDQRILMEGYTFLRATEHHLQLMHYHQTQTLPSDPNAQRDLARRLGFTGSDPAEPFLARYKEHTTAIRDLYLKYMSDQNTSQDATPAGDSSDTEAPEVLRHVARMDPLYSATFSAHDVRRHATLANQLGSEHLAFVDANPLDDGRWRVTVVALDYPGELALICGLMFSYGLDIMEGSVFTYEPVNAAGSSQPPDSRRKIVDAFIVRPAQVEIAEDLWTRYAADLSALLRLVQERRPQDARLQLTRRAAAAMSGIETGRSPLYPIGIQIDNTTSEHYTVLRITSTDTTGFLYELTNALALHKVYIARVEIETAGRQVADTLYVTNERGTKITDPDRLRELSAAAVLIKHFTHLLPLSPDPESALVHFGELVAGLFERPGWPDELGSLERPEVLESLARLLGVSEFLWQDFLRMQYSNLFPVVRDVDALKTAKNRAQLQNELVELLRPIHPGPQAPSNQPAWRDLLNSFKDREMFRIDMRHLMGHTQEFRDFSDELTALAEVIVNNAYFLCYEDLCWQYGAPHQEDGTVAQMSVAALGKCGGRELGFASDIELMFIYSGNGRTNGRDSITTAEFYEKLVEHFLQVIRAKREGIFEIDLQLRPYGKAGSLAVALESFRRYFAPEGPAWPYERQALVKLRPIAGDPLLGEQIEFLRDRIVYRGLPFDATAMRAMRERQLRHLVKGGTFNPKYSPGGLVDIEYLVQGLQMTHGFENPALRTPNTYAALAALTDYGIISPDDYPQLRKAYTFFRWLIDGLRVVAGNAKDLLIPPFGSEGFAFLARRMLYGENTAQLKADLELHSTNVAELNRKLLG
jgi:glutamate-ammonia-ligase adenylyltransferase